MPIYEFVCPECGLKFELLRPMSQVNEKVTCPKCHHQAGRVLSRFACFSKDEGGLNSSIGGRSCSGCSATSCDSCGS